MGHSSHLSTRGRKMNNVSDDYHPTESHYFHTTVQGQIKRSTMGSNCQPNGVLHSVIFNFVSAVIREDYLQKYYLWKHYGVLYGFACTTIGCSYQMWMLIRVSVALLSFIKRVWVMNPRILKYPLHPSEIKSFCCNLALMDVATNPSTSIKHKYASEWTVSLCCISK